MHDFSQYFFQFPLFHFFHHFSSFFTNFSLSFFPIFCSSFFSFFLISLLIHFFWLLFPIFRSSFFSFFPHFFPIFFSSFCSFIFSDHFSPFFFSSFCSFIFSDSFFPFFLLIFSSFFPHHFLIIFFIIFSSFFAFLFFILIYVVFMLFQEPNPAGPLDFDWFREMLMYTIPANVVTLDGRAVRKSTFFVCFLWFGQRRIPLLWDSFTYISLPLVNRMDWRMMGTGKKQPRRLKTFRTHIFDSFSALKKRSDLRQRLAWNKGVPMASHACQQMCTALNAVTDGERGRSHGEPCVPTNV